MRDDEWTEAIRNYNEVVELNLSDLLSITAQATRQLCAKFPNHNCMNGATNDWRVGEQVASYIKDWYLTGDR